MENPNVGAIVFFDGGCNLCSREIRYYRKLDRQERISWQDITRDTTLLEAFGISPEDAMRRFHVLDSQGVMRTGAPAFLALWEELPGFRLLPGLFYKCRLVSALDWLYNRFADWRYSSRSGAVCLTPNQQA